MTEIESMSDRLGKYVITSLIHQASTH